MLKEELQNIGVETQIVDNEKEKTTVIQNWRKHFCSKYYSQSKKKRRRHSSCDFDIMDEGLCGNEAIQNYQNKQLYPIGFFIRHQSHFDHEELVYCSGTLPDYEVLRSTLAGSDIYIIPERMKWTFVFTHEGDYVGDPFFVELKS